MKDSTRPDEVRDTVRAASVGSCIYCGATDQLSDEHIVPLALGGRFVLPDASCPRCAAITSAFECKVLRGFMLDARTAGGFPTYRPKNRPKSLPLQIKRDGSFTQVDLAPGEHPGILLLPQLAPPGLFAGRKLGLDLQICGQEAIYFGKDPAAVAKDLDTNAIQSTTNLDVISFARLLAKIGYSYAVACLGSLSREQIFVLPLILGATANASHWLGSAQFQLTVETKHPMHALGLEWVPDPSNAKRELLLARVKLFASSGATGYEAVIYHS